MDALFEFLFKYRPVVFERGNVVFGTTWLVRVAVLLLGLAAVAAAATYTMVRVRGTARDRLLLVGMRALVVAILVLALLHPALLVSTAVPQRNVVGVVIDDSRSMRVADVDGRSRADIVRSLLGGADGPLYRALAEKFVVRFFRVGGDGSHVGGVADLTFDGARTRLAPALDGVRQELAGVPLAGLVLVSDGADNAPGTLSETLLSLSTHKVPVFTVGVGRERFARDIEISRVEAPRTVLEGASLVVNVEISQRGFGGSTVQLVVEDSGRIVSTEKVDFPRGGEATNVRVRVPTTEPGARLFTFRVAPQPGEMVVENNVQTALVAVRNRKEKILYIEGEPRFELKFLRRAVEADDNLQLVTLMRTAKDKFLRLGVDDSLELVAGFPRMREELFQYRGIVLGSIEASYFTLEQLRIIADFVSERGGGLLMLGGRESFAEGGYAFTPVADVLPVELPAGREGQPAFHEVKVELSPAGSIQPATQIAPSEAESAARWKVMPVVTSVNRVVRAKPGATTLLTGSAPGGGNRTIALASQRYGRGTAIAFPIEDSWLWQMHADVPVGDMTYTSFWRQMLRWLVNDAPGRVTVGVASDHVGVNEPLPVDVMVTDKSFLAVNSAEVMATIRTPSGSVSEVPLEWSVTRDGEYHMTYTPTERGVHRIQVSARSSADSVTSDPTFVNVGDITSEYFGAELHASLLRRVAEETGGRYYTTGNAMGLANDLVYSEGGNTVVERLDLWDMPIVFGLLLALLTGEWWYRRARGLA
ncbi:MAG TPA: glutamine amidotransferase [Gemmatimonadaceae bacterium]